MQFKDYDFIFSYEKTSPSSVQPMDTVMDYLKQFESDEYPMGEHISTSMSHVKTIAKCRYAWVKYDADDRWMGHKVELVGWKHDNTSCGFAKIMFRVCDLVPLEREVLWVAPRALHPSPDIPCIGFTDDGVMKEIGIGCNILFDLKKYEFAQAGLMEAGINYEELGLDKNSQIIGQMTDAKIRRQPNHPFSDVWWELKILLIGSLEQSVFHPLVLKKEDNRYIIDVKTRGNPICISPVQINYDSRFPITRCVNEEREKWANLSVDSYFWLNDEIAKIVRRWLYSDGNVYYRIRIIGHESCIMPPEVGRQLGRTRDVKFVENWTFDKVKRYLTACNLASNTINKPKFHHVLPSEPSMDGDVTPSDAINNNYRTKPLYNLFNLNCPLNDYISPYLLEEECDFTHRVKYGKGQLDCSEKYFCRMRGFGALTFCVNDYVWGHRDDTVGKRFIIQKIGYSKESARSYGHVFGCYEAGHDDMRNVDGSSVQHGNAIS